MKSRLASLSIALFILVVSASLFAQDTASITGTVTDPSGAAVKGAQVRVSSPDRGIDHTVPTNDSGDYLVAGLPPGPVDVAVAAQGFKKFEAKGVILRVGQKARTDIALQVGASNTVVEVEGTAVAQVETQSSDLTGIVTGKQITQLELNGRNFTQLVTLIPGVSNQTGQDEGTVGVYGNISFSINGGRVEYNNWELDGGDNMDNGSNDTLNVYPSLEAISEFKVLTSNYGAQYGRNGSGTVEVETKSGTNAFHGNVYEFVRNDAFNATKFPLSTVSPYKKNDFGYTIGGPIWKNKTFFFWSQEWRRDRVPGQDFNHAVPSVAERAGDFTDQCTGSGDCPSGGPDLLAAGYNPNDPTVQALLTMIPLPNDPTGTRFIESPVQPTNWREELIRVDHNLTDKQRLTFRYIHDSWDNITPVPLWTNNGDFPTIQTAFKGPGLSLVTRLNSTFSPTLLNEFVFSYTTDHIILNNVGNWKRPANFVVPDIFPGNGDGILPGINLVGDAYDGGFGEDAGYIPNGVYNSNPTYTYRDNVSKIVGRHNMQFGTYREKQKQAFNFDPTHYQPGVTTINSDGSVSNLFINGLPNGIVQCGVTPGVPVSCMEGHLFNPAPRVGFAWDPRGNGKTAFRGGYGIFFEHANGNEGNTESLENSPPLANVSVQNNIPGYSAKGTQGAQFPLSVNAIPTKARWPYMQQWHLDVQQEVLRNTVATVSYVGSKGTRLNRQTNLNQVPLVPLSQNPYAPGEAIGASDCDTNTTPSGVPVTGQALINLRVQCGDDPSQFRPFAGFGDITHLEYRASSIYHALQTSVRRNVGGLQLSFAYTWSHSIDDSSDRYDGSFVDSANPSANRAS